MPRLSTRFDHSVRTEDRATYRVSKPALTDDEIIARAREILTERLRRDGDLFDSPSTVRDWLVLHYAALPHEEFGVIFLDARNRVLAADTLFRGTLTQTSVYPREVVKAALQHNASAVIIYHNHPSGVTEPSGADELLTRNLKDALQLVDVRVLDHFIVAGAQKPLSFAERGLI